VNQVNQKYNPNSHNVRIDRRFQQHTGFSGLMYRIFVENRQYFLAFFLPALILLAAYFAFGVYPFGKESVLSLDLNGQYVYYYDYMYDVFAGKESVFYSWSRNLSGEYMGIIGYYLASPFNFLVWAFPRDMITEGLLTMMVVKAGAIGLCASIYLRHGRGFSRLTSVIFPVMYALCGYSIVQTMNPMWLDGVMILPLIAMGVEALVKKGRFRLLTLALVYAFVTSFYIGFMIAIFTALYFLYYLVACDEFDHMSGGAIFARLGGFACVALTAAAISAFMILPVVNSLSLGKFTFSTPDYTIQQNFNLANVAQKFFPNSYDTVRMEGLPFVYAGVLTVVMGICFFLSGKISGLSRRRRMCSAVLLLVLAVCMYIRPADMMWHGGQLPNWLPYRYSFVISFLLIAWAAEAFDHADEISEKLIAGAALAFAAVGVYIEQLDTYNPELGNKGGREMFDGITVLLPAVLLILIITFTVISRKQWLKAGKVSMFLVALLVCGEAFYNTLAQVAKQDADIVYSNRDSYEGVILPTREVVQNIKAEDDGFYRIEKNYFRTVNDPLALQMYGLSHSSSTLNDKPIALLGKLGLTSRSHYTCYRGATPIVDDLFGIKYILSSPGNETGRITSVGDIEVETNADALPIAYLASPMISNLDLDLYADDKINIFHRQNRILASLLGEGMVQDYIRVIDPGLLEIDTENIDITNVSGGHTAYKTHTKGKDAYVEISLTAEADGELFMWLPSDYERKVNVYLYGRTFLGQYYESDYYCAKSLGEFKQGEYVTVRLSLTKDELYIKDYLFGYMDWDLYNGAIAQLNRINRDTVVNKISPTHLSIDVNADTACTLLTTVPNEPGWTVTVDGQPVEIIESLGALISVPVAAGAHVIDMKFTTGYYPLALYITGGGVFAFALACLFRWLIVRRYPKQRPSGNNGGGVNNNADDNNNTDDDNGYGEYQNLVTVPPGLPSSPEAPTSDEWLFGLSAGLNVPDDQASATDSASDSENLIAKTDHQSEAEPPVKPLSKKQLDQQKKAEAAKQKASEKAAKQQKKEENKRQAQSKKNKKSKKSAEIAPAVILPSLPNQPIDTGNPEQSEQPEQPAQGTQTPDNADGSERGSLAEGDGGGEDETLLELNQLNQQLLDLSDENSAENEDEPAAQTEETDGGFAQDGASEDETAEPDIASDTAKLPPDESAAAKDSDYAEADDDAQWDYAAPDQPGISDIPAESSEAEQATFDIPAEASEAEQVVSDIPVEADETEQVESDIPAEAGEATQAAPVEPLPQGQITEAAAPVEPVSAEMPEDHPAGNDPAEETDDSDKSAISLDKQAYDREKADKTIKEILDSIQSVNRISAQPEESEHGAEDLFPDDQIEKL
jgi:uncharacterized membrane protein YfhO